MDSYVTKIAIIFVVIWMIVLAIGVTLMLAATVGVAWGAISALINYGKSIKKNLVDANRPAAA
jgi:hypothetical protein